MPSCRSVSFRSTLISSIISLKTVSPRKFSVVASEITTTAIQPYFAAGQGCAGAAWVGPVSGMVVSPAIGRFAAASCIVIPFSSDVLDARGHALVPAGRALVGVRQRQHAGLTQR